MNKVEYMEVNFDLSEKEAEFHLDTLAHLADSVEPKEPEKSYAWHGYVVTESQLSKLGHDIALLDGPVAGGFRVTHKDNEVILSHPFLGEVARGENNENLGKALWLSGTKAAKSYIIQWFNLKRDPDWHPGETYHSRFGYNYFSDITAFGGEGGTIKPLPAPAGDEVVLSWLGYDITVNNLRLLASGVSRVCHGSHTGMGDGVDIGDGWKVVDGYRHGFNDGFMLVTYKKGIQVYSVQLENTEFYADPVAGAITIWEGAPAGLKQLWVDTWRGLK